MKIFKNQDRSLSSSRLIIVGSCLTILGCFLPWMIDAGCLSSPIPGISLHRIVSIDPWLRAFPFGISDNGGLAIILISAAVLFIWRTDYLRAHRRLLMLTLSFSNVLLAVYHLVSVLGLIVKRRHIFPPPQIMFGLPIVLVGTVVMLVGSVRLHHTGEKLGVKNGSKRFF